MHPALPDRKKWPPCKRISSDIHLPPTTSPCSSYFVLFFLLSPNILITICRASNRTTPPYATFWYGQVLTPRKATGRSWPQLGPWTDGSSPVSGFSSKWRRCEAGDVRRLPCPVFGVIYRRLGSGSVDAKLQWNPPTSLANAGRDQSNLQ